MDKHKDYLLTSIRCLMLVGALVLATTLASQAQTPTPAPLPQPLIMGHFPADRCHVPETAAQSPRPTGPYESGGRTRPTATRASQEKQPRQKEGAHERLKAGLMDAQSAERLIELIDNTEHTEKDNEAKPNDHSPARRDSSREPFWRHTRLETQSGEVHQR